MLIGEIGKNAKERIRISIDEFYGRTLINCRVYFRTESGEWRPTRKGIALSKQNINEVIGLLKRASNELKEAE